MPFEGLRLIVQVCLVDLNRVEMETHPVRNVRKLQSCIIMLSSGTNLVCLFTKSQDCSIIGDQITTASVKCACNFKPIKCDSCL